MPVAGIYRGLENESLRSGEAGFAAVDQKAYLKNISFRSGGASFAAAD